MLQPIKNFNQILVIGKEYLVLLFLQMTKVKFISILFISIWLISILISFSFHFDFILCSFQLKNKQINNQTIDIQV